MTNAKHTPGPWNLEAGRSIVTSSGAFYLSYGTDKASGAPHFSNFCELDANARLIAASPDLLVALEAALSFATPTSVRQEYRQAEDCTVLIEITEWPEWVEQAHAALAKAKGK